MKVVDMNGIWTCSWRVLVKLFPDSEGYEGYRHIPSDIGLGTGVLSIIKGSQSCVGNVEIWDTWLRLVLKRYV